MNAKEQLGVSCNLWISAIQEMIFEKFEKISKYSTTTTHRKTDHTSELLAVKYIS